MARRMLSNSRCPLCGNPVPQVSDAVLKKNPHKNNVELVVTRRGLKQYIHTDCWNKMIADRRPYNGKFYV